MDLTKHGLPVRKFQKYVTSRGLNNVILSMKMFPAGTFVSNMKALEAKRMMV